jgi:hypothetical protein
MTYKIAVSGQISHVYGQEKELMADAIDVTLFDTRKLKGRERRTQNVSTKLTQDEENELQRASAAEGKTLSEWARDVLLRSVRLTAPTTDHDPIVLTEIVGIQLFLMNVLSPLARGEHITPEQYQSIIKSVQASKSRTTQELLAKRLNAEEH